MWFSPSKTWLTLVLAFASAGGCALTNSPDRKTVALVDDITGYANDVRYRLVEVDGKPSCRLDHPYITYVPFVYLQPGRHTLLIRHNTDIGALLDPAYFCILVDVEAGCIYHIVAPNGQPVLEKNAKQGDSERSHSKEDVATVLSAKSEPQR